MSKLFPTDFNFSKESGIELHNYIFQGLDNIVLIPSIPGKYQKDKELYGIQKVKSLMRKKLLTKKKVAAKLTYNSTSLGTLDSNFMRIIYDSFAGCQGLSEFSSEKFKIVYPTQQYISKETCGEAQVLFLTSSNYHKSDLKNKILAKFQPSNINNIVGCIPHLKTMIL